MRGMVYVPISSGPPSDRPCAYGCLPFHLEISFFVTRTTLCVPIYNPSTGKQKLNPYLRGDRPQVLKCHLPISISQRESSPRWSWGLRRPQSAAAADLGLRAGLLQAYAHGGDIPHPHGVGRHPFPARQREQEVYLQRAP